MLLIVKQDETIMLVLLLTLTHLILDHIRCLWRHIPLVIHRLVETVNLPDPLLQLAPPQVLVAERRLHVD